MTKILFENKPQYASRIGESEIFDTRFIGGNLGVESQQKAFKFEGIQDPLPLPELKLGKWKSEKPRRITDQNTINGIEAVEFIGNDGESYSGFIQMLDVNIPGGEQVSVIRSWHANNDTGIPVHEQSWFAEFKNPEDAHEFWGKHWRPHFDLSNIQNAISSLQFDRLNSRKSEIAIKTQELGLLRPWFTQTTKDAVFLNNFSSSGNKAFKPHSRMRTDANYTPGNVYKIPSDPMNWANPKRFKIGTCLGAISTNMQIGWPNYGKATVTVIQWENGKFDTYSDRDKNQPLPSPLSVNDIKKTQTNRLLISA